MEMSSILFIVIQYLLVCFPTLVCSQNYSVYSTKLPGPERPPNRSLCPIDTVPEELLCPGKTSAGFAGEIWGGCICRDNCAKNISLRCDFVISKWVLYRAKQNICQKKMFIDSGTQTKFELKNDGHFEVSCNLPGYKIKPEKYSVKCENGNLLIDSKSPSCEKDEGSYVTTTVASTIRYLTPTLPKKNATTRRPVVSIMTLVATTNVPEGLTSNNFTSEPAAASEGISMVYIIIIALGVSVILLGVTLLIVLIVWIARKKCGCCDSSDDSYVDPNEIRYKPGVDTVRSYLNVKSHHSYAEINTPPTQQLPYTISRGRDIHETLSPYRATDEHQYYNRESNVIYDDVGPPETKYAK